MPSRSRSSYRGAVSQGNAWTIWFAAQLADGLLVTLMPRIRRRSCASTTKTNSTWNKTVGTLKKSMETRLLTWAPCSIERSEIGNMGYVSRNVRHVCDGGFLLRGMYFETVACETRIPSLSHSP